MSMYMSGGGGVLIETRKCQYFNLQQLISNFAILIK